MKRSSLSFTLALAAGAAFAADRPIAVSPALQISWEFVTPGTEVRLRVAAQAGA